jgi:PAS domain S-box-containing protein
MNSIVRLKYKRFALSFFSILLIFLVFIITVITSQHREMVTEIRSDAQRELELIGSFAQEALLMNDYSSVKQFLRQWAEEHDEILKLTATAPNDVILVQFHREKEVSSRLNLVHHVRYKGKELLLLEMERDLSPAQKSMIRLSVPLMVSSIFLTVIFGVLLWYALRKLALTPMEREIAIREQAERKFRLLLESAPDALIFTDRTGKILMVNAQTELLFGYNRNELEGKDLEMLMPERFRDRHKQYREKFVSRPEARPMGLDLNLYGITKKGGEFPADISLSPIETEEGLFILSAIRDMTERKLAEEKIKRSYNFQTAISSILSKSLSPVDLDHQLQNILDTILSIPGLAIESMGCIYLAEDRAGLLTMKAQRGLPDSIKSGCRNIPFSHCLCGEAAETRRIIFANCEDNRHLKHTEYGKDFPHCHYCVPILSGDKTLGVINLVVKKDHERSNDEEELLTSIANTLAVIIEHNSADIERQHLQTQLAQVEKLSALGRFTANVAHEIRTPLTLIGGFARRLDKHIPGGSKDKEYSDIIINEVNRLENILKNVLTYSRGSSLHMEKQSLCEIIISSLNQYQERCRDQSIKTDLKCTEIPELFLDRDQVIEVLNNILSNALDAMPDGGSLTISNDERNVHGKEYAVVNFTDTGEGMTREQVQTIFEPFYSTKIIGHGTGLGLPISKKIMEDHGGFITVDTEPKKGSTFSLYFPLQQDPNRSKQKI